MTSKPLRRRSIHVRPPARALAWFALAGLLLTGCSERSPARSTGGDAAAASPSAGFVNRGTCPPSTVPDLPYDAGCVSSVSGREETLHVYALVDEAGEPRSWRLRLDSPRGDIDQELQAGLDYPRAAGAVDLEGDGAPEWFVKITDYASHGAPWARLNLLLNRGGKLVALTLDGEPMAINYGGISRLGEGARCERGGITLLRTEAKDPQNTRWRLIERRYRIEGTEATFVGRRESTVEVDNYVDPGLRRYFHVECSGVVLIPF